MPADFERHFLPFARAAGLLRRGLIEFAHDFAEESVNDAVAGQRHQRDRAFLAGLEAHRGAGGDVQPEAARGGAIEFERGIGLEEMIMRADLDRPVAGVRDFER